MERSRSFDSKTFLQGAYAILKKDGAMIISGEDALGKFQIPAFDVEPLAWLKLSGGSPIFYMKRTREHKKPTTSPAIQFHRHKTWDDIRRDKARGK
jgi:hypothetical protein